MIDGLDSVLQGYDQPGLTHLRGLLEELLGGRGADGGGFADGVVEFGRWGVVKEDDHAVLVALVEDVGGEQYALARRDALGNVDLYVHDGSSLLSLGDRVVAVTR